MASFSERIIATAASVDRSLRETKGDAFVDRLHASLPKIHSSTRYQSKTDSTAPSPSEYAAIYDDIQIGSTEAETQKTYVDWASRVRFEYCDLTVPPPAVTGNPNPSDKPDDKPDDQQIETNIEDQIPNYQHTYNTEIRMLANADIPKRSLAIAKEVCVTGILSFGQ